MRALLRLLPYLLGLAGIVAAYLWAYGQGWDDRDAQAQREQLEAVQRAVEQANKVNRVNREIEQAAQEDVDNAVAQQLSEARHRAGVLADELEWLRNRPERLPGGAAGAPARAACQGATGAELSGPDAGFLTREAARADECRSALKSCYAHADAVEKLLQLGGCWGP